MTKANNHASHISRTFVLIAFAATLIGLAVNPLAQERQTLRWYKGNTHTHTINSDGDSTPDEVVRWYRERGYNFLVLSDHNYLTEVDGLNAVFGAANKFIIIKGEEVSDKFQEKPIHVNGLNIKQVVEPRRGDKTKYTPGHGWVMVRAANLSAGEILRALEQGDFYASTGVTLRDYSVSGSEIKIDIAEETRSQSKYTVQFIGRWGKILKEVATNPAVYAFKGDEFYVRAKVIESNSKVAWTQPVFLRQ